MDSTKFNDYTFVELKKIAGNMNLKSRRSKTEMINDIIKELKEYEEYKINKLDKYKKIKQLGNKGKEGITYLVKDIEGKEYAMKTFRKMKSSNTLKKECVLQRMAAKFGVAPEVISYDTVSKYIVMERMDISLIDVMVKQKGNLLKYQQLQILEIYKKLDEAGVFHNDANITNYMLKGKQMYLIDYGMSRKIDPLLQKKLKTNTPNQDIMLLGFILKLKEMKCPVSAYKYLKSHISEKNTEKFEL